MSGSIRRSLFCLFTYILILHDNNQRISYLRLSKLLRHRLCCFYLRKMAPIVQTVLGDVSPNALGRTLTHEHLAMEFTHFYRQPPPQLADKFTGDLTVNTVGYLRQYPYSWKSNLLLNDEKARAAVLNDVLAYKKFGGGTIVENSTEGLQRDVAFYQQLSKQTGVHIVAGTGHYIADLQGSVASSVEEIYSHMLAELTEGCGDCTGVKAGFMGEIASVWPIKDFERRAIRAAGEVQESLGFGVSFHPHREPQAPFEIMRVYLEAGGRADKAVMSHLDRTLLEDEKLLEFSSIGSYCQFDLFGTEVSYYQLNEATDMPSDSQRIDKIRVLVDDGKTDRVLMSHDIHTKHRLIDFGGHGYSHIINNVLPRMKTKGFSQEIIDQITISNPATWLTIQK